MALLLPILGFAAVLVAESVPTVAKSDPHGALLVIDGVIAPTSADFLSRGIETASGNRAQFLIVRLDTPGGLLASTRDMVEEILTSQIPVVVFVSPQGAQAASAGTFIVAAAHVAAMAPTTNIGAASPVGSGGEDLPETIKSKATQDAAAFIRSIAEERGRNADALEQTVLNATSYSASEALDKNIIDLIAGDTEDLLLELDGRAISLRSGEVVLATDGLTIQRIDKTPVERFLGFLADPNIVFLLLTIGGLGLLLEFLSPGLLGPGILGVIALALAFVALGNLPVNWVGVGLMALAIVLFFLEAQAPGIGIFGVSGGISFVLGAFLLFGEIKPVAPPLPGMPSFRVSLWVIGVVSALMFVSIALTIRATREAKKAVRVPAGTRERSLVGQIGTTATNLNPHGTVQVAGEQWSAVSDDGGHIAAAEEVIVRDIEGLILRVSKTKR